jgi:AcrR family transcriptional regulator
VPTMTATTGPAEPRARNRRGKGGRLHGEIVAAATQLLDETGTEQSVTLRAVARRAGITAPAIYGHFADRQAIMLAVVQQAFAELGDALQAVAPHPGDPAGHLRAVCAAYLDVAATHPQRYRVMFDGLWNAGAALAGDSVTAAEVTELGQDALAVLVGAVQDCVTAGCSTSSEPTSDAIALWLGLHGLAHQRAVTAGFPWPPDIVERLVTGLAHLDDRAC